MSFEKSGPPLRFEVRPSRRLTALLWVAHGGALLLLVTVSLPALGRLPLALAVMFSLYRSLRLQRRGVSLILTSGGEWLWREENAPNPTRLKLLPGPYVSPWVVVLNFREAVSRARRRHLVILPDSLDPESFRRLRARLRLMRWARAGDQPG